MNCGFAFGERERAKEEYGRGIGKYERGNDNSALTFAESAFLFPLQESAIMASGKDFLPNNDTELQAWLTNFVTILNGLVRQQ